MIDDEKDDLILTPVESRLVKTGQDGRSKRQLAHAEISERIVREALAIEQASAKESGNLGYLARILVQATMPHAKLTATEYQRTNGDLTISIQSPSAVGLPYGHYPRLLLSWITTEAVRTKSPDIVLGDTLTHFLRQLGLSTTGGRWGTVPRLRDHLRRLFCSTVSWTYDNTKDHTFATFGVRPIETATLWWDPKNPEQASMWRSRIGLNQRFYDEIVSRPVPLDMRILRALAHERSPLAIDIYTWLSYRLFYLKSDVTIPWEALAMQFGGDYTRLRDFRKFFSKRLQLVLRLYPEARVEALDQYLKLSPSWPSVPPKITSK